MRCQPIKPVGANISFLHNKKPEQKQNKQVIRIQIDKTSGDTFKKSKLPPKDGQE